MAAGDFTASTSLVIQEKLQNMFMNPTPATSEFTTPKVIADEMMGRQSARINPVLVNGKCIGYTIIWLKSGVDSVTYDGDGTTPALNLACDVADGSELESDSNTYTDNVRIISNVKIDTNLCNNDFSYEDLLAQQIVRAMNDIRKKLAPRFANFLDSNAQVNLDSSVTGINLGNGAWAVNADTITIEVPSADFRTPDSLAEVDAVVRNNEIFGNYFIMSGRSNYYNSLFNANYKAQNDNERNIAANFGDFDVINDTRWVDQTITGGSYSFAVNPNAYAVWNRSYSQLQAVEVNEKDGIWEFYVEDPFLMIRENGVMRPVRYEVVRQKNCSGRDSNTRHVAEEQLEVKYLGGIAMAPSGTAGDTGIVKFSAV